MSVLGWFRQLFSSTVNLRESSAWLTEWAAGGMTESGTAVSPLSSLEVGPYFACLRAISEDVGKLPASVFRRSGDRREEAEGHPSHWIVHEEFNPLLASGSGWEMLVHWALGWGNGYALIRRDGSARARELWPVHPDRVSVKTERGRFWYEVRPEGGGVPDEVNPGDMFHLRGLGDSMQGYSIARLARESIGLTAGSERFGASFFGNDATMGVTMELPADLKPEMKKAFEKTIAEVARKKFRFMVLPPGVKASRMMVPPEDIQFLETRQFQVEEVCRWFRMPPHKIQHLLRSTFSNIEHQAIEYVTDTLHPWVRRIEQESSRKLFGVDSRGVFYVKFNVNALLRGDYATRTQGYRSLISTGVLTINEARALEDMNPIGPNGDEHFMQGAMATVDRIVDPPEPPAPRTVGPEPARVEEDGGEPEEEARTVTTARYFPLFADAASRCVRREIHAVSARRRSGDPRTFGAWLPKFIATHRAYMESAFSPAFEVAGAQPAHVMRWLDEWQSSAARRLANGAGSLKETEPEAVSALADGAMSIVRRS